MYKTNKLRGPEFELFISTQKPHKSVTIDTIGRWIKTVMIDAGIDMSLFSPHSTRAAATSAAARMNVSIDTILRTAGWTGDSTFRKFNHKPVRMNCDFGSALLDNFHDVAS